jgi:UDP-glucose:(heptosyl)LPS alpha-1,3-glucosyltransferase
VKASVRQFFPQLNESRLVKLFNATDLQRFDPAKNPAARQAVRARFGLTSDHVVGLMLAQDFERKGLREALAALARVNDPRLVLLVAGKQDPSPYRRWAEWLGVGQRVHFAGATTDPYSFYQSADFFILPTRHDPCSLVVLEALAMGVPVISTIFNGACEIMDHRQHGIVLSDPANVNALAAAMTTLLDPARRAEMSRACLAHRPALSYEKHLDALEEIYRRRAASDEGVSRRDRCDDED